MKKPARRKAAARTPAAKKAATRKPAAKKMAATRQPPRRKAAATQPAKTKAAPRRTAPKRTGALPAAFADLEIYVPIWALPGSDARFRQRLNSTPEQRIDFYRALAPRGAEALSYLDSKPFDPDHMAPADRNLLRLMLALAEVSLTEEVNGQTVEAIHAQSNRLMLFTKELDRL